MTLAIEMRNMGSAWEAHVHTVDHGPEGQQIESPAPTLILKSGEKGVAYAHNTRHLVVREGPLVESQPTAAEKLAFTVRDAKAVLFAMQHHHGKSREMSLAITRLEEAISWAEKHQPE